MLRLREFNIFFAKFRLCFIFKNLKGGKMDTNKWQYIQEFLNFNTSELELFKENPRNIEVLTKGLEPSGKTLVAEVVFSKGCAIGHQIGEMIHLDSSGGIILEKCPPKICIYLLGTLSNLVYTAMELSLAGVSPNEMRFNRCGCVDVGLECGGMGHVVVELSQKDVDE